MEQSTVGSMKRKIETEVGLLTHHEWRVGQLKEGGPGPPESP